MIVSEKTRSKNTNRIAKYLTDDRIEDCSLYASKDMVCRGLELNRVKIGLWNLNRNRYYDPNIGRFTTADKFSGYLDDPLTMHPYVYGNNNPLRFTDPLGLSGTEGGDAPTTPRAGSGDHGDPIPDKLPWPFPFPFPIPPIIPLLGTPFPLPIPPIGEPPNPDPTTPPIPTDEETPPPPKTEQPGPVPQPVPSETEEPEATSEATPQLAAGKQWYEYEDWYKENQRKIKEQDISLDDLLDGEEAKTATGAKPKNNEYDAVQDIVGGRGYYASSEEVKERIAKGATAVAKTYVALGMEVYGGKAIDKAGKLLGKLKNVFRSRKVVKHRKMIKKIVRSASKPGVKLSKPKLEQLKRVVEKAGGKVRGPEVGLKGMGKKSHVHVEGFGTKVKRRHIFIED